MHIGDHVPPHFRATYAGREIQMSIRDRLILNGQLPAGAFSSLFADTSGYWLDGEGLGCG